MDVKSADFLSLSSDDSTEVDERLMDVQTILCCLQSLTDHIASLENKHIATYRLHKKNEVTLSCHVNSQDCQVLQYSNESSSVKTVLKNVVS